MNEDNIKLLIKEIDDASNQINEIDEKDFFELLKDYKSQEFKRARRGLITTSFIVILIFLTNPQIEKLILFDVTLQNPHLYWLGIILIIYWGITFILYLKTDKELQKEKETLLSKQIIHLEDLQNKIIEYNGYDTDKYRILQKNYPATLKNIKRMLNKYDEVDKRTESAQNLKKITKHFEITLPIIMGTLASLLLDFLIIKPYITSWQ